MRCLTALKYLIHQNNIIHLENRTHLNMHLSNRSSNHKSSKLKLVTIINEYFRTSQKLIDEPDRKLMSVEKTWTLSSYLPWCPFTHHSTLQQQHLLSTICKTKTTPYSTRLCALSHFLYCLSIRFIGRKTEMKTCHISFKRMMWCWKHFLFQNS